VWKRTCPPTVGTPNEIGRDPHEPATTPDTQVPGRLAVPARQSESAMSRQWARAIVKTVAQNAADAGVAP